MAAAAPRLTLFLPGLFTLPLREQPGALLAGLRLPVLARILGRARRRETPARDIEAALFALFGHPEAVVRRPPSAAATAALDGLDTAGRWLLRADPVHLRTDVSKAILFDAATFTLAAAEAEGLAADLAPLFAEQGWSLVTPRPARWYLVSGAPLAIDVAGLKQLRGADVRRHLPGGEAGREWRRLLNETQMVLHDHPVNRQREARGEPAVNSLWLWGAGQGAAPASHGWDGVWGEDELLVALAGDAHRAPAAALPTPAELAAGEHLVMLDDPWLATAYGDVEGWREALAAIETRWLAPLWQALRRGRLDALNLYTEAHRLELSRRDAGRWWRRPADPVQAPLWRELER